MVIDDLYTLRMAVLPEKADSPLIINANAIRPLAITLQRLKPIRRRQPKILQPDSRINRIEFHEGPLLNLTRESFHEFALKDSLGILEKPGGAPKAQFTETKGYRWYSQK